MHEAVRAEVSRYKVTDLIANRPALSASMKTVVAAWIKRHHLILVELAVGEIDFSEKYDDAIEAKQIEEQRAAAKSYELRGVETEAAKAAARAKGEADALREAAKGEADALRLRAEAQADFNRRIAESLTPMLVERMKAEKWDGKLPVYMLGSATPMIELPASK
jgi:regulator of protease activity HflC (stomatin/prohibitin superfamily)